MIGFIKKLFGFGPAETAPVIDVKVEAANSAPYKVPAPAETTPVPLVAEKAAEAMVKSVAPAKKKAAPKKAAAKPVVKKPATRGRKPKAK
jgi:hypothetical protein